MPERKFQACHPLDTCCCGCSLDLGVRIILLGHSLACTFYIITAVLNIIVDKPTLGYHVAFATQTFNCGYALASIPFIGAGISGVNFANEVHLRIYFYWFTLTAILDILFLSIGLAQNSCSKLPAVLASSGGSFTCGAMRIGSIVLLIITLFFLGYAAFVIFSRCNEIEHAGSAHSFDALLSQAQIRNMNAVFQHKSGLFGTGTRSTEAFPVAYGSLATPPFAGGVPIFGTIDGSHGLGQFDDVHGGS